MRKYHKEPMLNPHWSDKDYIQFLNKKNICKNKQKKNKQKTLSPEHFRNQDFMT